MCPWVSVVQERKTFFWGLRAQLYGMSLTLGRDVLLVAGPESAGSRVSNWQLEKVLAAAQSCGSTPSSITCKPAAVSNLKQPHPSIKSSSIGLSQLYVKKVTRCINN
jgi:hypothetical protein